MLEALGEVLVMERNHRIRWTKRRDRVNTWRVIHFCPFLAVNDRDYTMFISECVFVYTISYSGSNVKESCFTWKILWQMEPQIWEVTWYDGNHHTFALYFETKVDDVTPERKRHLRKRDAHFRLALPRKLDELRRSSGVTIRDAHGRNNIFLIDDACRRIRNVEGIGCCCTVTDAKRRAGDRGT